MSKAEKFEELVKNQKTTLFNRIYYFFLIRRLKKSAKKGYAGYQYYDSIFILNPYIKNRLERDGFKVKEKKDKNGKKCTDIEWIYKKENVTDDSDTDSDDTTND